MKEIFVRKLFCTLTDAEQVSKTLDDASIDFIPIDIINWPDFPYCPKVEFRIAHTGESILINYNVTEASVRAVASSDQGRVWEDSCCEFFVRPEEENEYYNFECNCAGTLLLNYGKKGDRHPASQEVLSSIKRWSSLGRKPFDERIGEISWQLSLIIPVSSLFNHNLKDLTGEVLRANFYKCGDLLQTPHFLSWSPINLPEPCFHCPDYFGRLVFE